MNPPVILTMCAIALMAGAYMLFLWASWQQYQEDRTKRDLKIDEMLARLPKAAQPDES